MNKQEKGFTLIELLAVIVILAIIALIAVPVVMNIISKANKSAFKDSAYGIIKAGELYYSEKLLDVDGMTETKTFGFPEANGLDLKGSRSTSGNMKVSKEGKIAIAISNGKYCIKKGFNDTNVTIDENVDNCELSKEPNPIITTSNACLTSGTCLNGTKLNIKVNDDENYDFYVIKDENNELTLIMDRNLGSRVAWATKEDYIIAGGTESDYGSNGNTNKGPITAINALEDRTAGWTNIPTYNYTYTDDGGGNKYSDITRNNIRARLLTYTEATSLRCTTSSKSCYTWLYCNLSVNNTEEVPRAYWLSSAVSSNGISAWNIYYDGDVSYLSAKDGSITGIRPVIKIPKTI